MAKKRKLKKSVLLLFIPIIVILIALIVCCLLYFNGLKPTGNKDESVEFDITDGMTYLTIADELKESDLIKSELIYKIYIKIKKPNTFQIGTYTLTKDMGVEGIIDTISGSNTSKKEIINITFKEGLHMRKIAKVIADNTNNSEEDVFNLLKNDTYINELINTYWFITDDIKNSRIYYSLEGYLFPETYQFENKSVTVKEIFKVMLDTMNTNLTKYKTDIDNSNLSIHELLTLASMIELEASSASDRKGVSGVFYNRLKSGWSMGSDVTTYYGAKKEMADADLTAAELQEHNGYNTRSTELYGKLPIGPICNPSMSAIEAAINPDINNYYYFVSDKNKKIYFNTTSAGHNQTISSLKNEGLWYTY